MSESQPGDEPIINIEGPRVSLPEGDLPGPATLDLETLDPSDSRLFQNDAWRPWFERLRAEDPVHYTPDSPFGPYWSVTSHADIMHVESHHDVFSSFPTIVIGDSPNGQHIENFIAMDPPRHEEQRKTVAGVVAPHNLVTLEPVIRGHAAEIQTTEEITVWILVHLRHPVQRVLAVEHAPTQVLISKLPPVVRRGVVGHVVPSEIRGGSVGIEHERGVVRMIDAQNDVPPTRELL